MATTTRKPTALKTAQKVYATAKALVDGLSAQHAKAMEAYDLDDIDTYVAAEVETRARLGLPVAERAMDVARDNLLACGREWASKWAPSAEYVEVFEKVKRNVALRERLVETCMQMA